MSENDGIIVERWVLNRDAEAFRELVARYSAMVYATCRRVLGNATEAEDVAQECFEKLAQTTRIPTDYLGPWLHRVAVNLSLNRVRRDKRRQRRETEYVERQPQITRPEWDDIYQFVDEAMTELPEEFRAPIIEHFLEGKTQAEVAARLDISRQAVTYRLNKGTERIRKALRKRGIDIALASLAAMLAERTAEAVPSTLTASLGKIAIAGATKSGVGLTSTAAAAAGIVAVKKVIVGSIAALVIAGAVYWFVASEKPGLTAKIEPTYTELVQALTAGPAATTENANVDNAAGNSPGTADVAAIDLSRGSMSGRVYVEETGEGLEGVFIFARNTTGSDVQPRPQTDALGRFRIDGLDPGTYSVTRSIWGWDVPSKANTNEVVIKAGMLTEHIDFPMEEGLSISGIVIDPEGKPVDSMEVSASFAERHAERPTIGFLTKSDGRFVLHGFDAGDLVVLNATSLRGESRGQKNWISDDIGPFTVGQTGVDELEIVVYQASTLSGKVVDTQGHPVAGALANLAGQRDELGLFQNWRPERSIETGEFRISNVRAHTYRLIFLPLGGHEYVDALPPWDTVLVENGKDLSGIVAVLDLKLSISGRVTDTAGRPIPDVELLCQSGRRLHSAQADENGNYTFYGLIEGTYTLSVSSIRGTHPDPRDVPGGIIEGVVAGSTDVVFQIDPGGTAVIEGAVVSDETGEPVTKFELLALDGSRYNQPWEGRQFDSHADTHGAFRLENIVPGPVMLVARAPEFAVTHLPLPDVAGGVVTRNAVIRLVKGVTADGVVQDREGNPVPNAKIYAGGLLMNLELSRRTPLATSDADGKFHMQNVSAGIVEFTAVATGYSPASLAWSHGNSVVITLSRGGAIAGRITYDGQPWDGQRVSIVAPGGSGENTVRSDRLGMFRIDGLPAGTVMLQASVPMKPDDASGELRTMMVSATVSDDLETQVEFDFSQLRASLEGTVTENGAPRAGVQLLLTFANEMTQQQFTATANAQGQYMFSQLPTGAASLEVHGVDDLLRASIEVQLQDDVAATKDIELSDGASLRGSVSGLVPGEQAALFLVIGETPQRTADIQVYFARLAGITRGRAHLPADGSYQVTGLQPGRYTLIALAISKANPSSMREVIVSVDIAEGLANSQDISF